MPFLDTLEAWSFRIFGKVAPKFLNNIVEFKECLERAGMKIYPETYVSLMLFISVLTIPVSIFSIIVIYFYFSVPIIQLIPIILLVPTPIYVMIGFMLIPINKAGERAHVLEREMPFAAAYTSVMASGGISPYTSFKRLAEVELMPVIREEAREIVKDVEIFGIDPLTAIENAAKKNPLETFKDFLSGYASTVIIGGDITHFLEKKTEDIFKMRALKVKAAAERLGMLLETFIIVMVLMSLCFYILFSVEATYSLGISIGSNMILYTYLFTPLLSMMFIYLAHSMQPKTPIINTRPYKVFAVSSVMGLAVFLLLTDFMGYAPLPLFSPLKSVIDLPVAVAVSLFITSTPAAIIDIKDTKKKNSMERGVNNFLRDLTEVRKTGLSPERCIESLAYRDYGEFSKELRQISSKISWGIPARKVILDFVKKTKSWLTQIVMFLLVETMDVGGGTVSMIETIARFNNLNQDVEKEKKMTVRPYILMPYFAAIMLVATTTMIIVFIGKTMTLSITQPTNDLGEIVTMFTVASIFHSYLIGIVAGKISEESIAAGFKHASILVMIAVLAAKLLPIFIKFE